MQPKQFDFAKTIMVTVTLIMRAGSNGLNVKNNLDNVNKFKLKGSEYYKKSCPGDL